MKIRRRSREVRFPKDHPLYWTWWGMKTRCNNPSHNNYHRYGGRGISIWEPWQSDFWAFVFYLGGDKPSPDHSLDRIDVNGHYEPGNVRWATWKEQAENKVKPKKPKTAKMSKPKKVKPSTASSPDERAFEYVLTKTTRAEIARHLGIKKQNLTRWKRVPPHHVPKIAEMTGLAREQILPSLYSGPDQKGR